MSVKDLSNYNMSDYYIGRQDDGLVIKSYATNSIVFSDNDFFSSESLSEMIVKDSYPFEMIVFKDQALSVRDLISSIEGMEPSRTVL